MSTRNTFAEVSEKEKDVEAQSSAGFWVSLVHFGLFVLLLVFFLFDFITPSDNDLIWTVLQLSGSFGVASLLATTLSIGGELDSTDGSFLWGSQKLVLPTVIMLGISLVLSLISLVCETRSNNAFLLWIWSIGWSFGLLISTITAARLFANVVAYNKKVDKDTLAKCRSKRTSRSFGTKYNVVYEESSDNGQSFSF